MIYILSILLLLSLIILFIQIKEKKKLKENKIEDLKDYFRKEWEEEETQLNQKKTNKLSAIENECLTHEFITKEKINKLDFQIKNLETQLIEKEKRYNEVNQDLDLYRKGKIEEIDAGLIELTHKKEILLENEFKEKREGELKKFDEIVQFLTEQKTQINEEVETLKKELDEFRLRRAAINEEILRQKQIEEQQDFYRIQIDPNEINDIEILRETARRLQRPEIINKIIWSGYYQKPLAELRKRIISKDKVSGIYKITRIKTGEVYIGQAVDVSDRWASHVKTALGVGTLASSQLHRVMNLDGCENFLFELLEETPKDKLKERESYYIDFYDSKKYGLNSISGIKNK